MTAVDRFAEISGAQCLDLLQSGLVGRAGFCSASGPRIVPVNYALFEDSIVWRTTPYSELGRFGPGNALAFEVDHIDYEHQQGWSVVALGRCEVVDEPAVLRRIRSTWDPGPWVGGQRHLYLRLRWHSLTGRVVGRDCTPGTMTPVRRTL
ncbi:MAG TPA: pyridoxamine 5'-phosphate oxidase family protein [Nocardioidaceae bacterium]|nr:pyridoxamine 5'-phosphate oxidase family protein [Nocardioidaceae bacterium]